MNTISFPRYNIRGYNEYLSSWRAKRVNDRHHNASLHTDQDMKSLHPTTQNHRHDSHHHLTNTRSKRHPSFTRTIKNTIPIRRQTQPVIAVANMNSPLAEMVHPYTIQQALVIYLHREVLGISDANMLPCQCHVVSALNFGCACNKNCISRHFEVHVFCSGRASGSEMMD